MATDPHAGDDSANTCYVTSGNGYEQGSNPQSSPGFMQTFDEILYGAECAAKKETDPLGNLPGDIKKGFDTALDIGKFVVIGGIALIALVIYRAADVGEGIKSAGEGIRSART